MDIRSFFGPRGGKGGNQVSTVKDTKKESDSVKRSSRSDVNGNHDKSKSKPVAKPVKYSERKKSEETVQIVDSDEDEAVIGVKKSIKNSKGSRKRTLDISLSDEAGDAREEESVKYGRKKKRKKEQVSSEDEDIVTGSRKNKKKGKKKTAVSNRILDSDSEEDPVPKKQRKKKKAEPIVFIGASEDEEEAVKPKKTFLDSFLKSSSSSTSTQNKQTPQKKSDIKQEVKQKTVVNAADFFGSGSVHRVDRPKVSNEELKEAQDKAGEKKAGDTGDWEDELHSDDDFQKTLELLDEQSGYTEIKEKNGSPDKEKKTLSSKLAAKVKAEKVSESGEDGKQKTNRVLVPDTPDPKKVSPVKKSPPVKKTIPEKKSSPLKKSTPEKKPSPIKTEESAEGSAKKAGAGKYRAYLHREGPRALGSKEIPEGAENCLEGLTFVVTGVLESLERDDTKSLIERHGGKVTGSLSKRTSYIVVGRDAGESKMAKAESFNTKQLDEDGLLDLIRNAPGKKSKYAIKAEESIKKENDLIKKNSEKLSEYQHKPPSKSISSSKSTSNDPSTSNSQSELSDKRSSQSESSAKNSSQSECVEGEGETLLWVDKYKPTSLKQIIGQQGDKSNARKLLHWLTNWHKNQAAGVKPVAGRFFGGGGGRDDGAGFKAALLSGPPGIGKTTTATLVCKEAGFSFVELNASDTRNARSLKEVVKQALGNTSMIDYISSTTTGSGSSPVKSAASTAEATQGHKHCMIMDEVDGMSGNEDRGGVAELVQLVKSSKIPIICMCNDRNHPKMRTLSGHCFDLRFQKPRLEQIKGAMMTLAYKEGLTIPAPALNEIIIGANQDIRQVIHNMSMWSAADKAVSYEQAKQDAKNAKKDMKIGPFDVCRKVFVGGEETAKFTLHDKSDLFFNDYSIAPLFVQENYPFVTPYKAKGSLTRHLSLLSRTAESISDGDLVDKRIRSSQSWGLLPTEAMFASVLPGEYMRGSLGQMVEFPKWLGKNSSTTKSERILGELRTHMRLQISGDKRSLNMDYLPYLRAFLTEPLVKLGSQGVKDVIARMDQYDIIKEDFDNIMDVSKWPNSTDPMSQLSSQTKSAFTRTYNKEAHMTPYSIGAAPKKKRGGGAVDTDALLMEGEEECAGESADEEEDDSAELDRMIKKKAPSKAAASKGKASSSKATTGKGKAPAKGGSKVKGKR